MPLCGFFLFIICAILIVYNVSSTNNVPDFSQPEPTIVEVNLAAQNTLKEVSVFSANDVRQGSHRDNVIQNVVPSRKYCGLQHTDDRVYTETSTALDEFPWLVDIVHQDNVSICPGVLITRAFVLTGYGCGLFSNKVRLGLYHTRDPITCFNTEFNECSDPVVEIKVNEVMYTNVNGEIALLKLLKNVTYTDFIRPICLPLDESIRPKQNDVVVASGWGKNVEDEKGNTKKRLLFDLKTPQQCSILDPGVQLSSDKNEFCFTSKEQRNDIGCIDDYGGPIMYTYNHQWFVEGILIGPYTRNRTYGYCSDSVKPIYGKKITTEILDWILETITP